MFSLNPTDPTAPAEFNVNVLSSRSIEFLWKEPKVIDGSVDNYIIEQVIMAFLNDQLYISASLIVIKPTKITTLIESVKTSFN